MLSQCARVRHADFRKPHQRAGMRTQRKQIGPELVMQFARDLLAFDVLERDGPLGKTPLFLDGIAQRRRQVVQPGADRGQFGRAARRHARLVMPGLDIGHGLRKRLERRQRPADDVIVISSNAAAMAEPTSSWVTMPSQISAISSSGCDVMTSDLRLAADRDRHAHRGLLRVNQRDEPRRRRAAVSIVIGIGSDGRGISGRIALPRNTDMTQPAEVADDLVQPRLGVRRFVQAGDDGFDKLARQPDHTLIFGLDAGPASSTSRAMLMARPSARTNRQKQIDPGAQG